jgi:hypothetical protein
MYAPSFLALSDPERAGTYRDAARERINFSLFGYVVTLHANDTKAFATRLLFHVRLGVPGVERSCVRNIS